MSEDRTPEGWASIRLGDCSDLIRGVTFPATAKLAAPNLESVGCLRTSNVQDKLEVEDLLHVPRTYVKRSEQFVQENDIIVSMSNSKELVGKAAIAGKPLDRTVIGGFLAILRIQAISARFLLHLLRLSSTRRALIESSSITTNIANLRASALRDLNVPVPPLAEQHRMVEAIDSYFSRLDDAVTTLERVQRNLKRYRASVLKAAVEGRLVPTEAELARAEGRGYEPASVLLERILAERRRRWEASGRKGKYKEPIPLDVNELPELPEGWCWVTLGQLAWLVRDGPHYSPSYVTEGGVPFITGGQVRPEGVDFDAAKRISADLHQELSKRIRPDVGDILYTKGGTTGIARVNTYRREFNVWVHVAVLKIASELDPFYVQHALNSPWCYAQAQRFTHGVGNQDLGLTRMVNISVPLPPLLEQHRIVEAVDVHHSVTLEQETSLGAGLHRLARLRQAILKWAFEGRLANQDPNDEAASTLLTRIKAQREATASNMKKNACGNRRARIA